MNFLIKIFFQYWLTPIIISLLSLVLIFVCEACGKSGLRDIFTNVFLASLLLLLLSAIYQFVKHQWLAASVTSLIIVLGIALIIMVIQGVTKQLNKEIDSQQFNLEYPHFPIEKKDTDQE